MKMLKIEKNIPAPRPKVLKIEKNIPVPQLGFCATLRIMEVGDSVLLPKCSYALVWKIQRDTGYKFTTHQEDVACVRVWRTA